MSGRDLLLDWFFIVGCAMLFHLQQIVFIR
jgi:hypothetical protein